MTLVSQESRGHWELNAVVRAREISTLAYNMACFALFKSGTSFRTR